MQLYLTDQIKNFPKHLEVLKKQPVMEFDKCKLKEKSSIISIHTVKQFQDLDTGFLFDYQIFPGKIMICLAQCTFEKRTMKVGDIIVQQVFIPPFKPFSQKLVFGVWINKIIHEPTRIGIIYVILNGHVEKGISIFTIEQNADQNTIFKIHTYSSPGSILLKRLSPIFSNPYQDYCTRQALLNVKLQLDKQ